jgi:hypothetical protein
VAPKHSDTVFHFFQAVEDVAIALDVAAPPDALEAVLAPTRAAGIAIREDGGVGV